MSTREGGREGGRKGGNQSESQERDRGGRKGGREGLTSCESRACERFIVPDHSDSPVFPSCH